MFTIQTRTISRAEGLRRIRLLTAKDLRPLADQYGVTVWKNGHKNKGWAGQVIEQYLGLPQKLFTVAGLRYLGAEGGAARPRDGRHSARKGVDGYYDD